MTSQADNDEFRKLVIISLFEKLSFLLRSTNDEIR